jgi:hypothetical protein
MGAELSFVGPSSGIRIRLLQQEGILSMIDEIGEGAGEVWRYLIDHPSTTLAQINKSLKLRESLFFMAIGWLAREDKLAFKGEGKATKLSLK